MVEILFANFGSPISISFCVINVQFVKYVAGSSKLAIMFNVIPPFIAACILDWQVFALGKICKTPAADDTSVFEYTFWQKPAMIFEVVSDESNMLLRFALMYNNLFMPSVITDPFLIILASFILLQEFGLWQNELLFNSSKSIFWMNV